MLNRIHYRVVTIIAFTIGLLSVNAQPPQLIPYQAIARDNAGNPVLNQNIGLRFSIHDQTISGTVVWQESQTVVSNNLGIIVTALGGITQLTSVDWGSGAKFLQVEMDIAGGTNYLDMGTQQMMSVPYALYAETSGSVINNGGGNGSFTHWIGEFYGGGIICHLWKDAQGVEHGLIASLVDLTTSANINPVGNSILGVVLNQGVFIGANSLIDGELNSNLIYSNSMVSYSDPNFFSVGMCHEYVSQGFDDWYLPSVRELETLYFNSLVINSQLQLTSGTDIVGPDEAGYQELFIANYYWSSTSYFDGSQAPPYSIGYAYAIDFGMYIQGDAYMNGNSIGFPPSTSGRIAKMHLGYGNAKTRAFRKF